MARTYLADCLDKGTTNPAPSECGRYADVVKIDHRIRVAQRCLRSLDDLRIDIARWRGAYTGEKQNVFGLSNQFTDVRYRKGVRSLRLEQPRQRRRVYALHLAIESRDGVRVRVGGRANYNFHGHQRTALESIQRLVRKRQWQLNGSLYRCIESIIAFT